MIFVVLMIFGIQKVKCGCPDLRPAILIYGKSDIKEKMGMAGGADAPNPITAKSPIDIEKMALMQNIKAAFVTVDTASFFYNK